MRELTIRGILSMNLDRAEGVTRFPVIVFLIVDPWILHFMFPFAPSCPP
jgi:hypothetical protein